MRIQVLSYLNDHIQDLVKKKQYKFYKILLTLRLQNK